ncbi:hypothetical protein FACS1894109_07220 [Spirochaetia bacterium]|nr:hypothetical protein FACS1894109_07220 [Spirochaetia bacterium]
MLYKDCFTQPIPGKRLYHYTSKGGFHGILKNNELWASHIRFLNDSVEFTLASKLLKERLAKKRQGGLKYKADWKEAVDLTLLMDADETIEYLKKSDVYVFSLSQNHDKLNMWSRYTDSKPGFCIGFNTDYLNSFITNGKSDVRIAQVLYKEEEYIPLLDSVIDEAVAQTDNAVANSEEGIDVNQKFSEITYALLLEIAPVIKSKDFDDEEEWRIIIKNKSRKDACLRESNSAFTPYYKFSIKESFNKVIGGIIIGPCGDKEYTKRSVDFLRMKAGLDCLIEHTELSYRPN